MRRLFPLFFLFALVCSVLWAQYAVDSTLLIKIDTLIAREDFSKVTPLLEGIQPDSQGAKYWRYFGDRAKQQAEIYYDSSDFNKAVDLFQSAIQTLNSVGRGDSLPTANLWVWKALSYRKLQQYSDVLEAYNEALRIYELNEYNSPWVAYAYKNAAQVFMRWKNYSETDRYLKAAIHKDSTQNQLLSIYGQLTNNAYWKDSLDLAEYYYEASRDIEGGDYARASLQSTKAKCLVKRGKYREGEILMQKALQYYQTDPEEGENRMRCYTVLADIAYKSGQPAKAERYFKKAEAEGLSIFENKSRELAKLYTEWGDVQSSSGNNMLALEFYQKAIIQAYPGFDQLDPAENPKAAKVPIETWAMNAPARKAALLLRNPSVEARVSAADCFDLAFAAAEKLRKAYGTDEAKLYLARTNYNLRLESTLNLWELYRQTGDAPQLRRLFALLEDNRANTLRDALQQQRALALSGVPDSLLQLEEMLRLEIASLQGELQEAESGADTAQVEMAEQGLFQMQLRYNELLVGLEKNYPSFHDFNQAGETADLSSIREALPPKTALLSFFDAGDRYLCLVLDRHKLSAYQVPLDTALEQGLSRFQAILNDKSQQASAPSAYFSDAYFLKQRLLPDSVLDATSKLIIVPDGRLAFLPFEALLTSPYQGAYSKAPYLLRSHALQYAWSASLLAAAPIREKAGKGLLQVAPFVEKARDGLALLPNSLKERPESTKTKLLQGEQAAADQFLTDAALYDVLHLSTHAHAGQQAQPGIEFYDRTVSLSEIYAQRLNASLVALSACETGAGKYAEGEGVLSLARAFAYAGARSLVASHWSVNERSTADLFAAFYQQLEKGLTKAEALRQAKLEMLAAAGPDARKSPFYWAAFTFSGTDGTVALEKGWPWWVWIAGGLALLVGVWGFMRYLKPGFMEKHQQ